MAMASSPKNWILGDETAKHMLVRVLTERPLLLLPPPLHRVPLRVGNVVEIVGPSPSAKTQILIQAAISCIVPNEWKGVHYGGLGRPVMFLDLDCRLDVLRLSQCLKHRILQVTGLHNKTREQTNIDISTCNSKEKHDYDTDLFAECMRRFLYIRCYNSFEFLAALKVLHSKLEIERKAHGSGVHLLMIDSIGAFTWIDRALSSLPQQGPPKRRNLSLQTVSETVVQEIHKLLLVHPMLVLATKTANLGDKYATSHAKSRASRTAFEVRGGKTGPKNDSYREYMPSIWQTFVTHRILVRASDDERKHPNEERFLSEWLLPALNLTGEFIVNDAGISTSP